ncbi:hypothetical protein OESDEN_04295 [Oesophagostomum dentatum]|uniref:Uncharacterized protein n=1 Tax=Oesophagostomum dentatum TaxID=61180 RepID=A0A0B1TI42_OESDE|nr:hypothetical protein OESDEN_04295 [Oesophagostomum dentatum]
MVMSTPTTTVSPSNGATPPMVQQASSDLNDSRVMEIEGPMKHVYKDNAPTATPLRCGILASRKERLQP